MKLAWKNRKHIKARIRCVVSFILVPFPTHRQQVPSCLVTVLIMLAYISYVGQLTQILSVCGGSLTQIYGCMQHFIAVGDFDPDL